MTVDDAGVDDPGTGHVDAFYERRPGHAHTFTVAPSWSLYQGLELGAVVSRDRSAGATSQALQVKWLVTPSRTAGCNTGVTAALAHTRGVGNTPTINGLLTCNSGWGASHVNLGGVRNPGGPVLGTWGIAHEREFGPVTAHVEAFGQRHGKPTFQVGARTQLTDTLQLDGSLGRSGGEMLFSVGVVLQF